jgi:hypothetical protein
MLSARMKMPEESFFTSKKDKIFLYTYQGSKEARRVILGIYRILVQPKRIQFAIDYMTPQQKEKEKFKRQHSLSFFSKSIEIELKK